MNTLALLDLPTLCTLAVACAVVGLLGLVTTSLLKRSRQPLAATVSLGLFFLGTAVLLMQALALEAQSAPEFPLSAIQECPSPESFLQPVEVQWAVTDAGRPVPLFTIPVESSAPFTHDDETRWDHGPLVRSLIRTDDANPRYNCHGFVFTGGRFWIRGRYVDQILTENGYHSTSTPRPGDIVVYRDENTGVPAHTGLIRAVLEETGLVLIESKMGVLGRFIHPADKHPYDGTTPTYYHTGRGSHVLRGLDGLRRPGAVVTAANTTF
jgi:hypothetical protein